jgi:GntR family transcriptional regulator
LAHYQLELGPVPLHHQVYLDLRAALDASELKAGDRVPPERELATRYGCSVITIRRALDELAREHRIERIRGRGTFVLAPRVELDGAGTMSFAEEMRERGHAPETRLVEAREATADEAAAAALGLPLGAPIFVITRLRLANGVPLILEEASLPAIRFPRLLASDLATQSLYAILADRYGIQVVRARETLEPVLLRTRESRLLDVPAGRPALLIEGVAFTAGGKPVEYTRSYVRGDRTRYSVERVVARHGSSLLGQRRPAVANGTPDRKGPPETGGFHL